MADLPFMMMDWTKFFGDSRVDAMAPETQGIYLLLLGKMWLNKGWLAADDRIIARQLNLDVRRWRAHHKPHIEPLLNRTSGTSLALLSDIYTQRHLTQVREVALDYVAKRAASTARARAAKAAKARLEASETEREPQSVTGPVPEPMPEPIARGKEQEQKKEGQQPPTRQAVPSFLESLKNGFEHDLDVEPASDPALVDRLVSDGLRRGRNTSSLFGALQAAIREDEE